MALTEAAREMIGRVEIRPEQWYAWFAPALLVTDQRGSASRPDLTGLYFRETRCVSRLRLEVNAVRPWLCATGSTTQDQLAFAYVHPEMAGGGAGGSGAAGEKLPRDEHGLPRRALDLLATYRIGFCSLEVVPKLVDARLSGRSSVSLVRMIISRDRIAPSMGQTPSSERPKSSKVQHESLQTPARVTRNSR